MAHSHPALIASLVAQTTSLGSVTTSIIPGFAAPAVVFGAYPHTFKFFEASLYIASVAKASANPVQPAEVSRGYDLARSMTIVTPFVF